MIDVLIPFLVVFVPVFAYYVIKVWQWLRTRFQDESQQGSAVNKVYALLSGMIEQNASVSRAKKDMLDVVLRVLALPVTISFKAILFGNRALRYFVVIPSLLLVVLFCAAEVSGQNGLHWFTIFSVVAVAMVFAIEFPAAIALLNVFKATRRTVGVVLARTFLVVLLASFIGVATPLHELEPLYLRVLIVMPLAVMLPFIGYLQWAEPQPRSLIWRPWFLLLVLLVIILIAFSLAYRQSHNELPLGVERLANGGSQAEVVAIHQDRLCFGDSVFRYSDNAFQVKARHDCWSDMVYLPATVSSWKMTVDKGGGCVRLWFPSQSGDYIIAGQRGDYFSCVELQRGANSYQGNARDQFRVRKSSTGSTQVLVQWE